VFVLIFVFVFVLLGVPNVLGMLTPPNPPDMLALLLKFVYMLLVGGMAKLLLLAKFYVYTMGLLTILLLLTKLA